MDKGVSFAFLALSTVLAANVAADWPLIDTMFMRVHIRANDSYVDVNLKNISDVVSLLDKSQKTAIYIHGYLENVEFPGVEAVTKALLNATSDNVCSLDYRYMALDYPVSVEYVPHIAAALAAAINDMVEAGLNGSTIHLIGFSLGGQISAYTGRNSTVKIERITGLDPAGPDFDTGYLQAGDALFVFIIHTDMGYFGINRTSGDVDFMPNFGIQTQRGCLNVVTTLPDPCSHERAWQLFAESILNRYAFPSAKCNSDADFKNGTCDKSSIIPMGYYTSSNASGVYYCQTNSVSPYSLGDAGAVYDSSRA